MDPEQVFALIFTLGMFSGVFIIFLGLRQRSEQLQMQHRERMAMIERGQVPPPESVGYAFTGPLVRRSRSSAGVRSINLGIVIVAAGLGLMTIISIAGDSPETGLGIGGAIAIVGAAFIAIGMLKRNALDQEDVSTPPAPPIPRNPDRID